MSQLQIIKFDDKLEIFVVYSLAKSRNLTDPVKFLLFSQSYENLIHHFCDYFTKLCIAYHPFFFTIQDFPRGKGNCARHIVNIKFLKIVPILMPFLILVKTKHLFFPKNTSVE